MTAKPIKKEFLPYIVDASVAVKWFSEEVGRQKALDLLKNAQSGKLSLYAPDLLLYEVGNALWKGKRMPDHEVNEALFFLLELGIEFVRLDPSVIEHATKAMASYDLTFYDAVYAAIAIALSGTLVSANPKDHAKIKDLKMIRI